MTQHIIIIHGRDTKPAESPYRAHQRTALLSGLNRICPDKAEKVRSGAIKVSYVYYGDIINDILSIQEATALTDNDPENKNAPCLPNIGYEHAISELSAQFDFSRERYNHVLRHNKSKRYNDDMARAASFVLKWVSRSWLNGQIIKLVARDMRAYLTNRKFGSEIRMRLQRPLIRAFVNDHDVCLIAHSMGAMVAYDVLWKMSHLSEYRHLRTHNPMVRLFLTMGSPLGGPGVRRNLYDAHETAQDRYPRDIIHDWVNISAKDDRICYDPTIENDFAPMLKKYHYVNSIRDFSGIYNCYCQNGHSDPHNIFGYLAHSETGRHICDWIK